MYFLDLKTSQVVELSNQHPTKYLKARISFTQLIPGRSYYVILDKNFHTKDECDMLEKQPLSFIGYRDDIKNNMNCIFRLNNVNYEKVQPDINRVKLSERNSSNAGFKQGLEDGKNLQLIGAISDDGSIIIQKQISNK